ncbi:MAG TPA: lipid-A-disaccharide synthase [Xanthomonadales bacterium]|nr:lipid-A-disaccharide synthase [Xanthomonadales bacterium]
MTTLILCAGEASGDQLGAGLIAELQQRRPELKFAGIGGPAMRAAGMDTWWDAQELAVMGLVEVLKHLPRLLRLRREFIARIAASGAALYIGIDAPDFNLGVERRLKGQGMRTLHYVSPSIWAWRQGRAKTIGESADRVLCLFPFEPALYARHGVDARFVGHPFADEMPLEVDRAGARLALGLRDDLALLALVPGSRRGEIERLGADFLGAAAVLCARRPDIGVLVAASSEALAIRLRQLLQQQPELAARTHIVVGQMRAVLAACDIALVASGTATLEAALSRRPMVVGYRIATLTYWIVRALRLLKVRHYSLPNVLAGRELVPEISQNQLTPQSLAEALERWLDDPAAVASFEQACDEIHRGLRCNASVRAADAVLEWLP